MQLSPEQLATVRKLCLIHCSVEEIARIMEISFKSLYNWLKRADHPFTIAYHAARAEGQVLLRQLQFASAARGCTQMLIHLGKQYLGQSDEPRTIVNVSTTGGLNQLTAEQQKDLERLYADIQKRAIARASRELE